LADTRHDEEKESEMSDPHLAQITSSTPTLKPLDDWQRRGRGQLRKEEEGECREKTQRSPEDVVEEN